MIYHQFICKAAVQATATWKELTSLKRIVCEPRGTGDMDAVMKDYYGAIETGRGAIMFAIFRGKVGARWHVAAALYMKRADAEDVAKAPHLAAFGGSYLIDLEVHNHFVRPIISAII